eukprot:m.70093 g.70093  ORF g.70093 m.70093 type:complete len:492 (-) comp14153_c0_seq2:360-1835(-)
MAQAAVRSAISKQQSLRCDQLKFIRQMSIQPPSGDYEAACTVALSHINISKPTSTERDCEVMLSLDGLKVIFEDKRYTTVTHGLNELQFYLYYPPNIFVFLTKGSHEGFSQLNVVRCVDEAQSKTMFEYLHEATQRKARSLKQKKSPPVRPKPPVAKPNPSNKPKDATSCNKPRTTQELPPPRATTRPTKQVKSTPATVSAQAEPPQSASPAAMAATAVDNPSTSLAASKQELSSTGSASPVVPKRTRTKPHKRIALKSPASPGRKDTTTMQQSATTPHSPHLTRSEAVDPQPPRPVQSSPALKRKGQHTDFSNPSVSLSDVDPSSLDAQDNLDTSPSSLTVPAAGMLSVESTASLGSLRETPEPAASGQPEEARSQSPVARRRRFFRTGRSNSSNVSAQDSSGSVSSLARRLSKQARPRSRTRSGQQKATLDDSVLLREPFALTSGLVCFVCDREFTSAHNFCSNCGVQIVDTLLLNDEDTMAGNAHVTA